MSSHTTPYTYQIKSVRQIERLGGRCPVFLEQGLGKSFLSLLYAHRNPDIKPIVVVCPASVKYTWEHQAKTHFGLRATVLEGTTPNDEGFGNDANLYVVNYDVLGKTRAEKRGPGWLEWLKELKPKLVIVDECQSISDMRSLRRKSVKSLCQDVPHILALSGTPLLNRPAELWPTLNILWPERFPSFFPYAFKFCGMRRTPWGWDSKGASNLPKLHQMLNDLGMIRFRKADVLKSLPSKQRTIVPLEIDDRRQYEQAKHDFLIWLAKNHSIKKVKRAARAKRLVQLGCLKRLAAQLKMRSVETWLDDFLSNNEGKLIAFATHRNIIERLHERYQKSSVVIDGSVTGRKRQLAIDRFTHKPKTRILIGNIKAAGTGLNLQIASTVAFVELAWNPGTHVQAEDRCILEGTPILTIKGWIPIEQIKIGDKVLTHTGRFRIVNGTKSKGSRQTMAEVKISGWKKPLTTTADHKYLLENGEWKEAHELKPKDWLAVPKNQTTKELLSIPFIGKRVNDTFVGAGGWTQRNGRLRHAPKDIEVSDDFLFTIGYYCGDGFASYKPNKGSFISLSGNTYKKVPAMKRCQKWMTSQNLSCCERIKDKSVEHRYFNKEWACWFAIHCGRTVEKKKIPKFALRLNQRQTRVILEGLACSDGYDRKGNNRIEYVSSCYLLSAHVFILAQRAGHRPSITFGSANHCYTVTWGGNRGPKTAGRVVSVLLRNPIKDKEKIYDLSVEKDHSFMIGNSIVHNCHRLGQKESVNVYYLIARETLEEKLLELIQSKQKTLSATLDGGKQADDLNIFDQLCEMLERESK